MIDLFFKLFQVPGINDFEEFADSKCSEISLLSTNYSHWPWMGSSSWRANIKIKRRSKVNALTEKIVQINFWWKIEIILSVNVGIKGISLTVFDCHECFMCVALVWPEFQRLINCGELFAEGRNVHIPSWCAQAFFLLFTQRAHIKSIGELLKWILLLIYARVEVGIINQCCLVGGDKGF